MTDITDAGPRLKAMNDRLEELRTAADQADAEYRAEIERLRLTPEELEAIAWAAGWLSGGRADPPAGGKDALWSLLFRLSPPAT